MRQRLFFISLVLVIFSIASGFGLRYASAIAWTEPGALPPGDNVPAPINVGAGAQSKTGDLTVGGNFSVGGGQIVGAPAGGNMGLGTLNAEQLCIQGNCRVNWPEAVSAFVDEGNVGFGPTAVLGTNDNVPLSLETNGIGRIQIGAAGNVGVGTTNTAFNLMVGGVAPRIYLLPVPGSNPELDFGSPAMDTHWAIYRDAATDQLRFWRTDNRLILTSGGNVGIGVDPAYKLDVAGQINANTNLTPAIQGISSGDAGGFFQSEALGGVGVYGITNGDASFGVYGLSNGESSMAVSGTATSLIGLNKGGQFFAGNAAIVMGGDNNIGVMAAGGGSPGKNYGGYFKAQGSGYGVYSTVTDAAAWSGYFIGGKGVYVDAGVVGAAVGAYRGPGTLNAEQLCIQGNCIGAWPAGAAPGGVNGQIQFNDVGTFGGDAGLTYDKAADVLTVGGNLRIGMGAVGNDDYIYFDDGSKYLQWQDAMARVYLNSAFFIEGQMTGTGGINTISGSWISAADPGNQKNIRLRHDGVNGILDTNSAGVISPGNLVLMAPYVGTVVQVQDDLNVTGVLSVNGNATVLGRNICLQDGTNCPAPAGIHIIYRCNDGAANEGRLIADYGGSEAKVFCGGAGTYSDTGLRAQ